jgi:hypothetical protein
MAVTGPRRIGPVQRRALTMLAYATRGYTRSALLTNGFTSEVLTSLVRGGLATMERETTKTGGTKVVTRLRITNAAGARWPNNRAAGQRPSRWRRTAPGTSVLPSRYETPRPATDLGTLNRHPLASVGSLVIGLR